ncbi:hypothetical protein RQM47_06240 [Rubrivirga sp. S365]|uniref:CdaR family protein n=1 Tax=Rubrivirga sp. S365 TaxID=3076080 RepID=UPI0028C559FC|nr:hypothetical protein [Rubrivirga sp. S365]MDT7856232.1 hypothetical protein [Rubrivirga sp. S365]
MSAPAPRRWDRLGVRGRLRALFPSRRPAPPDDEAGRRSLALGLSLVVAAVLWFSFSMREAYSVAVEVPVQVASLPAGQALREPPPASATVTLQGEGWTLLTLTRRRPAIRIAATGPTVDLASSLRERGLPSGVSVQSVQPRVVDLALDARTTRRLPIRLRRRIETRPSYGLLRPPVLRPDSVTVSGAQSLLGRLADWPTETLVAQDVDEDFTRVVALSDTFGGLLTPSARSTMVSVEVGQFTGASRDVPVEVENLPPGVEAVQFDPATVRVAFDVPSQGEAYDRALEPGAFRAVVDYADIARDTTAGSVPVALRYPDGLGVRDPAATPARVDYFVLRRRASESGGQ